MSEARSKTLLFGGIRFVQCLLRNSGLEIRAGHKCDYKVFSCMEGQASQWRCGALGFWSPRPHLEEGLSASMTSA